VGAHLRALRHIRLILDSRNCHSATWASNQLGSAGNESFLRLKAFELQPVVRARRVYQLYQNIAKPREFFFYEVFCRRSSGR